MRSPVTSEPARLLPRVGRYEILLDLQNEGFVSLMAARVRGPNAGPRLVELAKVEHTLGCEAEVKAAFLAEARAAGRVRHANFVHPTDTLVHESDLYSATEFTLGIRLDELWRAALVEQYEIPLPVSLRILLDVLAGLSALHASGANAAGSRPIVHGDVAPTNIVISYRGDTRVVHSGLSLAARRVGAIDRRNLRLPYKAPEQLRSGVNAVPVGPAADVFAVGVLLWEILQGSRLFEAPSDVEVVEKILHGRAAPIDVRGDRHIPIILMSLTGAALERNPDLRIPHAAQLGEAIERASGVEVASVEDVALVVDQLAGALIERRREQLETLIAQANEARPSEGAIRVSPAAQLSSLRSVKTPVGLIFPPTPLPPRTGGPAPERFGVSTPLPPPSSRPSSQGKLAAAAPISSRAPSSRAPITPKPLSPHPIPRVDGEAPASRPRSDPPPTSSPVGWIYYIALGACVGTLVFMFVNGPGHKSAPTAPSASATAATPPSVPEVLTAEPPVAAPEPVASPAPTPVIEPAPIPTAAASSPSSAVKAGHAPSAVEPRSAPAPKPAVPPKPKPSKAPSDIPSGI
jgi:serine/threonine-protein kinase